VPTLGSRSIAARGGRARVSTGATGTAAAGGRDQLADNPGLASLRSSPPDEDTRRLGPLEGGFIDHERGSESD
jgi:hypothetical protein